MSARIRSAVWFIALTFLMSWGLAGLALVLLGDRVSTVTMLPVMVAYMFMPLLATVIVRKVILKQPLKPVLGLSFKINRWFFVAWLLPAALALLALGVGWLWPGVEWSWEMDGMVERFGQQLTPEQIATMREQAAALPVHPLWLGLAQGLLAGLTVNALAGFGEEAGWRGLLQDNLKFLGFWRSSFFIGLIWGIWHVPLILNGHNYPLHPREGAFFMVYFTLLFAPLFAYVRAKAKSVVAAAIMHGSLNGTAGISFMVLKGGSDLTVGLTGAAGLIVLALANVGLWGYDKYLSPHPLIPGFAREE